MGRALFLVCFHAQQEQSTKSHKTAQRSILLRVFRGSCYVKSGTFLENERLPCTAGRYLLSFFMRTLPRYL